MTATARAALLRPSDAPSPIDTLASQKRGAAATEFLRVHATVARACATAERVAASIPRASYDVIEPKRPNRDWLIAAAIPTLYGVGAASGGLVGLLAGFAVAIGLATATNMSSVALDSLITSLVAVGGVTGIGLALKLMWRSTVSDFKKLRDEHRAELAQHAEDHAEWRNARADVEGFGTVSEEQLEPLKRAIAEAPDALSRRCVEAVVADFAQRALRNHGPQLTTAAAAWLTTVERNARSILDDTRVAPEARLAYAVASHGPTDSLLRALLPQVELESCGAIAAWIESQYYASQGAHYSGVPDETRIALKEVQYLLASARYGVA